MSFAYYHQEHAAGYDRLDREGKRQWNDLFEEASFEHFQNREFLERSLTELDIPTGARVLEYGCGTGPAACFLAARGYRVDAFDLIPKAIALARGFAAERGVEVNFDVRDICELPDDPPSESYDVILDSYCLQSIVTDEDRAKVFAAVHGRLDPAGYYLISTAMYDPERVYREEVYDEGTGICYRDGRPHRRHVRPSALRAELTAAGFRVIRQTGDLGGDIQLAPAS